MDLAESLHVEDDGAGGHGPKVVGRREWKGLRRDGGRKVRASVPSLEYLSDVLCNERVVVGEVRAQALRSNEYFESDMAWMDMKSNAIDVVIGPIETYEDQLFGYKAAHESYVLLKDNAWSQRLAK